MTKQTFENLEQSVLYCRTCKRTLDKKYFNYSLVKKDGTASRCKYCDWIKRHNGIPIIPNYEDDFVKRILEDIIFEKEKYLNDLALKHNIELDKLISLIKFLHIGNKKMIIKSTCSNCKKDMEIVASVYKKSNNLFCCNKCYFEFKKKNAILGKNNPSYNRIKTNCSNCGKEIEVIPYNFNLKNSFGDNHNFCSQKCYWNFRSKYYIKEKSSLHNRIITDEEKILMKERILKTLKKSNRLDTKIQLKINSILDKNNINYEREFSIKYYSVDNFLKEYNLIIEVMGDYWHSSPLRYGENKYLMNEIQYKTIRHDKQKHTYILNHLNVEILYLWEKDIEKYPQKCEALILEYIRNKGSLPDYNSFNYSFHDNKLKLNSQIIIPYLKQPVEEIRKYLKASA